MENAQHNVLIIADTEEMMNAEAVWGTGGWLPPEDRRALDWFTLCRLSGLRPQVTTAGEFNGTCVDESVRWLILACDPAIIDYELTGKIRAVVERSPITIICQATEEFSPIARWLGSHMLNETAQGNRLSVPGWPDDCNWTFWNSITVRRLHVDEKADVLANLDGLPLIVSTPTGMGHTIMVGFDPGVMRDAEGVFTRLLQRLIVFTSPVPLAWLDWSGTLVLRMDDPGSSEALYNQRYHTTKLNAEDWRRIGDELGKRNARLSVCYVPGWVDAGEIVKGNLEVNGTATERIAGKVHASPAVRFKHHGEHGLMTYDHVEEFESIQKLRNEGLVEVELHGHTHITPDWMAWMNAPDRFENNSWFREFGKNAVRYLEDHPEIPHPIDEALKIFETYFHVRPTSLICPGEEFTHHVLVKALAKGFPLVSSYYLAIKNGDRFCWAQHVCAPYLDIPAESWFDAALPVVGYFHDFDIAENGVGWFSECLDQWQQAGARRIIDLGELAAVLGLRFAMTEVGSEWELEVHGDSSSPLRRAFELQVYFPDGKVPSTILCTLDGRRQILPVTHALAGVASVRIGE